MVFCDWLLSLSTVSSRLMLWHVSVQFSSVAQSCPTLCDPILHSFLWSNNIRLYGYIHILFVYSSVIKFCQLIDIWVVSPFWLLCILLLWTLRHKFLYGCVLISLGYISRCRITGSLITLHLTLWGTGFCSKVGVYHRSRQQCLRVPASPALVSSVLFQLFCWACGGVPCGLVCISLMTNGPEHHFTCSLAICLL